MTDRTFHFVRHEHVPHWLQSGWIATPILEGTHHGQWSVCMEWLCDCPMVRPRPALDLNATLQNFLDTCVIHRVPDLQPESANHERAASGT